MNGKTEIWESAEQFRQKHLGDLGKVPADVLIPPERLKMDFDAFVQGVCKSFPAKAEHMVALFF